MRTAEKKHSFDIVFMLALFCVFAAVSFTLVAVGGELYKSITDKMDESYEKRTAFSYITNKIHYADGEIEAAEIDGASVLVINGKGETEGYAAYIYCKDGALRELFTKKTDDISLEGGSVIVELDAAYFALEGEIVTMTITTTDGVTETAMGGTA